MNDSSLSRPHVERDEIGPVPVVRPVGDFDLAYLDALRTAFHGALAEHPQVVLDLSRTTFVDSTVLGVIVSATKKAASEGGWVRLAAPLPNVRRVLEITALDKVLSIYDEVAAAVEDLEPARLA